MQRKTKALSLLIALVLLLNFFFIFHMCIAISNLQNEIGDLSDHVSTLYDHQITQAQNQLQLMETIDNWINSWQIDIFETSAYSPLDDRNDLNSWSDGSVMASGVRTAEFIDVAVAVDPDVIPLGSKVWIEGIGWRAALDTGWLIHGKKIDICMKSFKDAIEYGRKNVLVIYQKEEYQQ